MAEVELGEHQAAIDRMQGLLERMGDYSGFEWAVAWGWCIVAFAKLGLDDVDEARQIALTSLRVGADTNHPLTLPFAMITLAFILHHDGDTANAARLLASARTAEDKPGFFTIFAMTRIKAEQLQAMLGDAASNNAENMVSLAREFLPHQQTA